MSWWNQKDFAADSGPRERAQRGMIRRMAIGVTRGVLWQLVGHKIKGEQETVDAEPFTGVGFYSRPRSASKSEAVLVSVGDAKHAVIIATRDEDLRRLWKTELEAGTDVTALFNSATIIMIKPDGSVEIRSRNGVAQSLATKADLQQLAAVFLAWAPVAQDGGAALKALLTALIGAGPIFTWPTGTTILKGE